MDGSEYGRYERDEESNPETEQTPSTTLKPFKKDELLVGIESALNFNQLTRENKYLRNEVKQSWSFDNIVGKKTMAALDSEMLALEARGGGGLALNLKLDLPESLKKLLAEMA